MWNAFTEERIQTILLVEDNPDHRELISVAIRRNFPGITLLYAEDGTSALGKLGILDGENGNGKSPIDLVILDVNLPGLSGYEILRQIRNSPEQLCLPVILTSTSSDIVEKRVFSALGADEFVEKSRIHELIYPKIVSVWQKRKGTK